LNRPLRPNAPGSIASCKSIDLPSEKLEGEKPSPTNRQLERIFVIRYSVLKLTNATDRTMKAEYLLVSMLQIYSLSGRHSLRNPKGYQNWYPLLADHQNHEEYLSLLDGHLLRIF
jgi:hypothetical protein